MINLDKYFEFLSIPSISTDPSYAKEVLRAANWVKSYLDELGFKTELWETKGYPIVFGSFVVDPKKPTFLIYNHYDVQPVEPLSEWKTPPFTPTLKNGQVYARGAQDNKGQCFYVLSALKHLKEKYGTFPLNIKVVIEGEEEIGSAHFMKEIPLRKKELKADYLAIVDLGIPNIDTPAITLGTRGIVAFEIEVSGSKIDLHSGCHGGMAYNPIHALTQLLGKIRDDSGKITIPGFYDDVESFSKEDLQSVSFDFNEEQYKKDFGITPTGGETKYSPLERQWLRPTFEISGISGGYTGEGMKNVIPTKAIAKCTLRLVPHQTPEKMGALMKNYFEKHAPPGTQVKVHIHEGGGDASRAKPSSKAVQAFAKALTETFGKPCKFILEGATISIIPNLIAASEAEPVLMGLGLPTDLIHAPNEHFGVDRLEKGAKIMARGIEILGGKA